MSSWMREGVILDEGQDTSPPSSLDAIPCHYWMVGFHYSLIYIVGAFGAAIRR